jgi:TRAP-type C4-dicarboxylate transport system permease small subunit
MVFVAGFSAGVRNLTRFDIQWANQLLTDMEWADSFLRKATMWLAFLGASQATYYRKHISIDVLTRIAPLKSRYMMHAAAGIIAGLITFALSYSLAQAVKLNLSERPIEYEVLGVDGSKHVCDASKEEMKNLEGAEIPHIFCGVRSVLRVVGVQAETPGSAFQIIVPFMFFVIGLRFLGIGVSATRAVLEGEEAMLRLEAEEHARIALVHASLTADGSDSVASESHAVSGVHDADPPASVYDDDPAEENPDHDDDSDPRGRGVKS